MKKQKRAVIILCGVAAFLLFAGCVGLIYYIDTPQQLDAQKQQSDIKYESENKIINLGITTEMYVFLLSFNCKNENCKIICAKKDGAAFDGTKEAFLKTFGATPDITADFKNDRLIAEITKIGGFFINGEYFTGVETVNVLNENAANKEERERLCALIAEFVKKEIETKSGYIYECSNAGLPWLEDNRGLILSAINSQTYEFAE